MLTLALAALLEEEKGRSEAEPGFELAFEYRRFAGLMAQGGRIVVALVWFALCGSQKKRQRPQRPSPTKGRNLSTWDVRLISPPLTFGRSVPAFDGRDPIRFMRQDSTKSVEVTQAQGFANLTAYELQFRCL